MAIPQQNRPVYTVLLASGGTEQWVMPVGFTVGFGAEIDFIASGASLYPGGQTLICENEPTPVATAPEWNWTNANITVPVAGSAYSLRIPLTALTPAAGQSINETGVVSKPDWLLAYYDYGSNEVVLTGTAPATGGVLQLRLYGQSVGDATLRTNKDFEKAIASASAPYAQSNYRTVTKRLTVVAGPDGVGTPAISLLYAPAGYDKSGTFSMTRLATPDNLGGLSYPFTFPYNNIVTGQYIGKIVWLNQTRYFTLDIVDSDNLATAALSLSSSVNLPAASLPVNDGTVEPIVDTPVATSITAVDYAWQKNSPPGSLSNLDLWFGSSDNSALEVAYSFAGGDTVPKGNYQSTDAGNFGSGYTRRTSLLNASSTLITTIYIRKVGTTTDLKVQTLPVFPASGTIARTNVYTA